MVHPGDEEIDTPRNFMIQCKICRVEVNLCSDCLHNRVISPTRGLSPGDFSRIRLGWRRLVGKRSKVR
jgi:sulfur relay (sulfurtransferase) complex TusBCD TusD component (DsrE family)